MESHNEFLKPLLLCVVCFLIVVLSGCMRMPFKTNDNNPPDIPKLTIDTHFVQSGAALNVSLLGKDPEADRVSYQIKVQSLEEADAEPEYTNWTSYYSSNKNLNLGLKWSGGLYSISLRCKDDRQLISDFSDTLHVYFDSAPPLIVSADSIMVSTLVDGTYTIRLTETNPTNSMVRVDAGDGSNITNWMYVHEYEGVWEAHYEHSFPAIGTYQMRAQIKHPDHTTTAWSAPFTVRLIPQLEIVSDYRFNETTGDFVVEGDYAYMTNDFSGVVPFNLQNPLQPVTGEVFSMNNAAHLVSNEQTLFVYTNDAGNLFGQYAYNLSNPASPTLAHSITPSNMYVSGVSDNLVLFHTTLTGQGNDFLFKIYTYDNAVGFTPRGMAEVPDKYGFDSAIAFPYAYVLASSPSNDALYTVNISDFNHPQVVDTKVLDGAHSKFALGDGYLYVTHSNHLETYSLLTPAHPELVHHRQMWSYARDIHYGNGYLAVAVSHDLGLLDLYTIYPDGAPVMAGTKYLGGWSHGVWCGEDYIYLISDYYRFITLNYPAAVVKTAKNTVQNPLFRRMQKQ